MTIETLEDLYLEEIADMYNGCGKVHAIVDEMIAAASHADLKDQLSRGKKGMAAGMDRMQAILERHGRSVDPNHRNRGFTELAEEAKAQALDTAFASDALRDIRIAGKYIELSDHGITGYETFTKHAEALGFAQDHEELSVDTRNMKFGVDRLRGLIDTLSAEQAR